MGEGIEKNAGASDPIEFVGAANQAEQTLVVARTPRSYHRFALQPARSSPGNYHAKENQAVTVPA